MALDENGLEKLDTTPVAVPLKFRQAHNQFDMIRAFIRGEFSRQQAAVGMESFEEAEDFFVGDDIDPSSPFELDDDQFSQSGSPFQEEKPVEQVKKEPVVPAGDVPPAPQVGAAGEVK